MVLFLLVVLAYTPVWSAQFVWDDDAILTGNSCIVGPLGFREIWTTSAADICPLTLTTFWVEHLLWGLQPLPYHLVNVLMHGLSALLLWQLLKSLGVLGAWLGAALWALHPVQVESVAWITEMKNTQSGLFFLLSILFFVTWMRTREANSRTAGRLKYALTLFFAALAMVSKSSTVILPVVLCLCAWWIEGRWNWRNAARVVPFFVLSTAASALSIWTQGLQLATVHDSQWVQTFPQRLAAAGIAVWFYLGKVIWPHPLISIYPRWQIDAAQWLSYLPLLAVAAVLSILILRREPFSRSCLFSFTYFIIALLPVLGLIDNPIFRLSLVFDHFQYLASIGPLALAGSAVTRMSTWLFPAKLTLRYVLPSPLLLVLTALTCQRAFVYQNKEVFWTNELSQNPDCWLGHFDLGDLLLQDGLLDQAIAHFQKAVETNRQYFEGYNNLGVALAQRGQPEAAMAQYEKAIDLNPNFLQAHINLGQTFLQRGQWEHAASEFEKVIQLNPDLFEAHNNLGVALGQNGQLEAAVKEFREVLRLKPGYRPAKDNLDRANLLLHGLPASVH
jgi:protein O-mannosyl-transferase